MKNNLNSVAGAAITTDVPLLRSRDEEEGGSGSGRNHGRSREGRPKQPWKGEFVKSVVYAGLDAIVTCFSLISSISAGHLSSDFVSSSTEKDVAAKERAVTEWDVIYEGRSQRDELLRRYQALGMDADDATAVVNIFAKYKDRLVEEKMVAEKGMVPPDEAEKPWKNGVVTLGAFLVFGSAPLLSFIVLIPFTHSDKVKFVGACVMSALALALLGIAKAKIAGQNYVLSAAVTLFNGAVAAAAAYAIGWTLRNVAGLQD
ncbi:uncharacterized protein LOC131165486 isoform X2 [Malania oleifera]|uniref:uncharacterized protein LOC131165486 isoform X2 n=1 Tax=Malania oleifera TaxID=397392 RepID=UPI0025AE4C70|nr:uncharacterized protein LOC131165486 isoform X2 [Malania oleifera]